MKQMNTQDSISPKAFTCPIPPPLRGEGGKKWNLIIDFYEIKNADESVFQNDSDNN